MLRNILLVFTAITAVTGVRAQEDYSWWNTIHQWDGVTPWPLYMTVSPSRFGPNALPVPVLRNGVLDSTVELEVSGGAYFSPGDDTYDSQVRLAVPIAAGRVVLESFVVPVEFYRMDTITRDLRAARDRDGKGRAGGDICFSTQVQLVKNHKSLPDISFEAALRTASGTNLSAARYTDAPGYWFSVSAGKDFTAGRAVTFRPYLSSGFYAFQTYDVQRLQDDCLLWGVGLDLRIGRFCWVNQLTGYRGYNDNGDRPVVFRSQLLYTGDKLQVFCRYQDGLHDFAYRSMHIGISKRWRTPKK